MPTLSRTIRVFVPALLMLGFVTSDARASLVIALGDATVASGGIATIDIGITSTTGMDTLSAFNLELMLTPVGSPSGTLSFSETQPDFSGNANYVFYGQSALAQHFGDLRLRRTPLMTLLAAGISRR